MNISTMSIIHFPRLSSNVWKHIDCEIINNIPRIYLSASLFYFLSELNNKKKDVIDDWNDISNIENEYSNIFDISVYKPISHLYFKIIEITQSIRFNFKDYNPSGFVMFSFAPNMFDAIEPIYNLRKNQNDKYYGFSKDNNYEILQNSPNIHLIDFTNYLLTDQYKNYADLIYCEGGNKNDPEYSRIDFLFLEITQALCVQAHKGSLIIKLYDCFHKPTSEIIFILSSMYDKTYIIKPNMSDKISSERFLVCNGFLFSDYKDYSYYFEKAVDCMKNKNTPQHYISSLLSKTQLPIFFRNKMNESNTIIGQQQLEKIYNIFEVIEKKNINDFLEDSKSASTESKRDYKHINYKNNMRSMIMWCEKYGVEYIKPDLDFNDNNKKPNIFRESNI
jgi:hypothetical protein